MLASLVHIKTQHWFFCALLLLSIAIQSFNRHPKVDREVSKLLDRQIAKVNKAGAANVGFDCERNLCLLAFLQLLSLYEETQEGGVKSSSRALCIAILLSKTNRKRAERKSAPDESLIRSTHLKFSLSQPGLIESRIFEKVSSVLLREPTNEEQVALLKSQKGCGVRRDCWWTSLLTDLVDAADLHVTNLTLVSDLLL